MHYIQNRLKSSQQTNMHVCVLYTSEINCGQTIKKVAGCGSVVTDTFKRACLTWD